MNEDQYNKFFRDKLLQYPSRIPDNLWKRIQDKKKRRFFFYLLLTGLLLACFTLGYFLMQKSTNKHYKENNTSLFKQKSGPANNNDAKSIIGVEKKVLPGKEKNKLAEKPAKKSVANPLTSIHGVITKNTYPKRRQYTDYNTQNLHDAGSKHFYINKKRLAEKQKLNMTIANAAMEYYTTNEKDSTVAVYTNNERAKDSNDSTVKVSISKPAPLAIDSSKKNIAQRDTSAQKNKNAAKKKSIFFTVYFSPGIPMNTFKADNTFYTVAYLKTIYKMKLSYTAGVSVGKTFGRKFSIQTGLLYSQINMKLQPINSANLNIKGRYSNTNIPFIIGYDFGHGSLITTIHTGIMYNLSASSKGGAIYDSTGSTVNIYKSSTGINFYFGLGFTKRLNNKMNLFGEPYLMYRPTYITKSEESFKQQISLTGISFGLKYEF